MFTPHFLLAFCLHLVETREVLRRWALRLTALVCAVFAGLTFSPWFVLGQVRDDPDIKPRQRTLVWGMDTAPVWRRGGSRWRGGRSGGADDRFGLHPNHEGLAANQVEATRSGGDPEPYVAIFAQAPAGDVTPNSWPSPRVFMWGSTTTTS